MGHEGLSLRDMADSVIPPQPRAYHGVNWEGLKTLYLREVRRFWKVGMQTVAAPVVTTLLYMLVFVVAVGGGRGRARRDLRPFVAPA
jgi:ABC-2 type transport system permease protein